MRLTHITLQGFKSFAKKTTLDVTEQVTGVVGPNGSGKSNIAEAIRFVLGEQSMKSMRSKIGADVIFKGSPHLAALSRATVTMVIDNRDKRIKEEERSHISESLAPYLVYDELTLARTIYADGVSEYTLNDAKVRLKDVQELLSFAGIGGSAHTIINQGEADRILLASSKDRKEALEDALGLRVYHLRLTESTRKLEKVKTHVREVELLRNEIKPHLEHLSRQVRKIESQEEERKKLFTLLVAYLQEEDKALKELHEKIEEQGSSDSLALVVTSIEKELALLREVKRDTYGNREKEFALEKSRIHAELTLEQGKKDELTKTLGRLEGEKLYYERELAKLREVVEVTVPAATLKRVSHDLAGSLISLNHALDSADIDNAKTASLAIGATAESFFATYTEEDGNKKASLMHELEEVVAHITSHEAERKRLNERVYSFEKELLRLQESRDVSFYEAHEEEKKKVLLESKLRELQSTIALRRQQEGELAFRKERYEGLRSEGVVIVGRALLDYASLVPEHAVRTMKKEDLLRAIERAKVRIEEASIPNKEEVMQEYVNTKERDEYLSKELIDIQETQEKLYQLIDELTATLTMRFKSGIEEVSTAFSEFFSEIFPGGKARLLLTTHTTLSDDGEEEVGHGVELDVSLPNKKVKEIGMFSGGERALVSIALLFAMSQVTPPPFMVLDETDAPLDESNARKYGMMLKRLSMNSKLLVITHNRETMNHCDMLYGVTLGVEGGSKLLSINFKEAEKMVR